MTDEDRIHQFTKDVYLTRYGRQIDDITDEDGVIAVENTMAWLNMFLDELEMETDSNGQPIDWNFLRNWDDEIGTVSTPEQTFPLPEGIQRLAIDEDRPLVILQDGTIISSWNVVSPDQITRSDSSSSDRVTVVRDQIVFSRSLNDTETGGTVVADTISSIPRLADDDVSVFDTVKPYQLLVLGVAKNATLPDTVQGTLTPSFVQKYADLLEQTKLANSSSSESNEYVTDDYSHIGGV